MDLENQPPIDINQADEKTLTQLRGVGSRLAKRIVAARPFESVDDLTRVRGISARDVERLRPLVTAVPSAELEVTEEIPAEAAGDEAEDAEVPEGEAQPEIVEEPAPEEGLISEEPEAEVLVPLPEIEDETWDTSAISPEIPDQPADEAEIPPDEGETVTVVAEADTDLVPEGLEPVEEEPAGLTDTEETAPEEPAVVPPAGRQPNYLTRGRAFGLFLFTFFFSVIIAIAITLGIISSLNRGGLTFASPGQVTALKNQVGGLAAQTEIIAEDLDGLRTRMDNLEALSGRVNDVEANMDSLQAEMLALQTEIETAQAEFDELTSQMDAIHTEIETLTTQNSRFESFLEGLQELLMGLFSDE
jgi:prefoldin subunit 5